MRTIEDIENEEQQLKSRLIEVEVEIKNHPEKMGFAQTSQQPWRILSQAKSLGELENERESIRLKLKALDTEKTLLGGSTLKRPGYGELKTIVEELVERDGFETYKTVPSTKINSWIREFRERGIELRAGSIRKKLSELGYSTEKIHDD